MNFIPLQGDDLGVLRNDNYRVAQAMGSRITFSYARKGKGMDCHFAADKTSLRSLKGTINAFCEWIFHDYPWCECIFAVVDKNSVDRLVKKCGFRLMQLTAIGLR